jgi:hypothetical protein
LRSHTYHEKWPLAQAQPDSVCRVRDIAFSGVIPTKRKETVLKGHELDPESILFLFFFSSQFLDAKPLRLNVKCNRLIGTVFLDIATPSLKSFPVMGGVALFSVLHKDYDMESLCRADIIPLATDAIDALKIHFIDALQQEHPKNQFLNYSL